jgi:hypothetical protein
MPTRRGSGTGFCEKIMLKQQASRAFSSEVAPGSRKENASKQKLERDDDPIFKAIVL